ncbi:hypothetical protein EPN27_00290 [Patescibacteria group bacterium]|nr:MAG: hypothetical protein EPN27_00290 [Patescibacteria group bacterium]
MSTFVMGGIGPMDVSNGIYLLLFFITLFFLVCVWVVTMLLKGRNSNQTMGEFGTEGEYPVGAEATLPDSLCMRVAEALESKK